jgi:hypothetical protein
VPALLNGSIWLSPGPVCRFGSLAASSAAVAQGLASAPRRNFASAARSGSRRGGGAASGDWIVGYEPLDVCDHAPNVIMSEARVAVRCLVADVGEHRNSLLD